MGKKQFEVVRFAILIACLILKAFASRDQIKMGTRESSVHLYILSLSAYLNMNIIVLV